MARELFAETLGLTEPWYVESVVFDKKKLQVDVHLAFRKGAKFPCPECGEICEVHDTKIRTWKHLYHFQYPTYIHAGIPRVKCQRHGTRQTNIPWSKPKSRFSEAFEHFLVVLCREMTVSAASQLAGIQENRVWRILHRYVKEARKRQNISRLRAVGVDEASVRKGHNYVSIFCDLDKPRVIHVEEGKDASVLGRFRQWIQEKGADPARIEQYCCDMSPAYILGINTNFPQAEITFDRYHVMAMVNQALDTVRRQERATGQKKRDLLRHTRYLWLKNPSSLTQKQANWLMDIKRLDLRTAKAYHLKIALQRLWDHLDLAEADRYLKKWYFWATHSRLEPMIDLAKMIKRHWDGVLMFIQSRITNGMIEGLINKIRTAMKRAYGFKKTKYLKTIIYLVAGDLDLPTPRDFAQLQLPTQS